MICDEMLKEHDNTKGGWPIARPGGREERERERGEGEREKEGERGREMERHTH